MNEQQTVNEKQQTAGGPELNLFQLGKAVSISYGITRKRREFFNYQDEQRELTFHADKGEIDSLESEIGKLLTVTLEVVPNSHTLTVTLLLQRSIRQRLAFRLWQ
jgi:hypothetical protein